MVVVEVVKVVVVVVAVVFEVEVVVVVEVEVVVVGGVGSLTLMHRFLLPTFTAHYLMTYH